MGSLDWDTPGYHAARRRSYERIRDTYPALVTRGFSCNTGWHALLAGFFDEVADTLRNHPEREFGLLQVKEKFGGLRIYYRLLPFSADDIGQRISAACRVAENTSMVTCDVCGQPGVMRKREGWYATRCAVHADGGIPIPGGGGNYCDEES